LNIEHSLWHLIMAWGRLGGYWLLPGLPPQTIKPGHNGSGHNERTVLFYKRHSIQLLWTLSTCYIFFLIFPNAKSKPNTTHLKRIVIEWKVYFLILKSADISAVVACQS
jgi:hypothetical protein